MVLAWNFGPFLNFELWVTSYELKLRVRVILIFFELNDKMRVALDNLRVTFFLFFRVNYFNETKTGI